jgi:DNA polymerase III delta subunit
MILIHGNNIVASRNKLNDLVENFSGELIRFDGGKLKLGDLKQGLESTSLFGQEKMVVVENLFSRRPSKEKEAIIKYLKENQPTGLIIWEGKKIDGRSLTSFSKAKIFKFELQSVIFRFLDSLAPGNEKSSLGLLHQCLKNDTPEIVFYMLARQIRLLLMARDMGQQGLENMASWQKNKLVSQAKKFSFEQLHQLHRQLLKIDWEQKTGQSVLPLKSTLDLLIAGT